MKFKHVWSNSRLMYHASTGSLLRISDLIFSIVKIDCVATALKTDRVTQACAQFSLSSLQSSRTKLSALQGQAMSRVCSPRSRLSWSRSTPSLESVQGWEVLKIVVLLVFAILRVVAEEPSHFLSHEQFMAQSKANQESYLIELQKMLSDLEKYQATKGSFREPLSLNLFFERAYAIEEGGPCIFAGKLKTWEKRERGLFCPSPGYGICHAPEIECNPLVFGPGVCTTRNAYATRNCETNSKSVAEIVRYISDPSRRKEWDDFTRSLNDYCKGDNLRVQGPECGIIQFRLAEINRAFGKRRVQEPTSPPEILQDNSKKVVFFGGYQSSQEQMKCWEAGAKRKNEDILFQGIPYPAGAKSTDVSAVEKAQNTIRKIVEEINHNPTVKYVIAGHSSGSAIANAVAERVKNPEQIELVTLEGYTPNSYIRKRIKTSCWYAEGPGGLISGAGMAMKKYCNNPQKNKNTNCKTKWCTHFSLVNTSPPDNLSDRDYANKGYLGCATNLDWLSPSSTRTPPAANGKH